MQHWKEPSPQEKALADLARNDLVEVVNRLVREGMDPRIVIAGIGATAADAITCVFGNSAVAPWFERQGAMMREVIGPER